MNVKNDDINKIKELDRAIEKGDINEIMSIINEIPDNEPETDVKEFSRNIIEKCSREAYTMKSKISRRIAIAAAAIVAVTGVSVGAATILSQFTFFKNGNYVTVTSNENLSREEAEKLADDAVNQNFEPNESNTAVAQEFETIEDAEREYNMKIVLPEKMPELELVDVTGNQMYMGENSSDSTIWINYGDAAEKAFGLTVTKNSIDNKDDVTVISSSDAEKDGEEFVSDKGYKFNVLKDVDEDTGRVARILTANEGEYEYSMVFIGFDENEINTVVNSVDLSQYKK